jgi:hypothetical protein
LKKGLRPLFRLLRTASLSARRPGATGTSRQGLCEYEPRFILPLILITGMVVVISLTAGSLWFSNSVRR